MWAEVSVWSIGQVNPTAANECMPGAIRLSEYGGSQRAMAGCRMMETNGPGGSSGAGMFGRPRSLLLILRDQVLVTTQNITARTSAFWLGTQCHCTMWQVIIYWGEY